MPSWTVYMTSSCLRSQQTIFLRILKTSTPDWIPHRPHVWLLMRVGLRLTTRGQRSVYVDQAERSETSVVLGQGGEERDLTALSRYSPRSLLT